ncbi:hypothetical protein A3A49_02960 [Candidatus Curtissbacteria bacterium RIFCSPLOWO2_01_FULL_38_11b]|uniref:Polyprenol-phosphate-mannose--protein mannosyltransferase n=1 Tax=Candidatus Curtissbacteria bacterium RIFCSPLOWO2_01_FULL_38_11b TaxID=1797725 RepID=A0A1F5H088_9BACT|nr:MAG: hypothetical protein A3A49_02960 [Candidatus Curtissbacteria bacterium RIFCSPLOWO2_01_FULL_38_11b]
MQRKLVIFITVLTLISLFLRAFRLSEPPRYYFDEVYHAVTAKAYADNIRDAYDPFSKAPKEGTAYDWLHPPLAKLMQAGSIKMFGDAPLGWRLPSVIFGTAIIPLTFILAFLLFGPIAAIFSATVIAFENLTFVMSRITMNDVFVTVFSLVAFIFLVLHSQKKKFIYLVLCALFLGFAVSSKWTGAYTILAVAVFIFFVRLRGFLRLRTKLNFVGVATVPRYSLILIIPAVIYLLSYGQFWLQGHSVKQFVDLNKQIWWYQNRHDLEHTYGTTALFCVPKGTSAEKTWCPWILNARGVYFSYEQYGSPSGEAGDKQSLQSSNSENSAGLKAGYIYALGNPLIFWGGIIAVSFVLGKFIEERKKEYALILLGYFVFWVPWIFTPRLMFLYHYLPSLPFLAISLGVSLAAIYKTKFKYATIVILLVFIAVFFYFYPISSGLPIDPNSIDRYMWLSTWR